MDMDKVRCTLRQMVRDWSAEGATERDECYQVRRSPRFPHLRPKNQYKVIKTFQSRAVHVSGRRMPYNLSSAHALRPAGAELGNGHAVAHAPDS